MQRARRLFPKRIGAPSKGQDLPQVVYWLFFLLSWIFLVFPQMPFPFRVIAVLACPLVLAHEILLRNRALRLNFIYWSWAILVGLIVVLVYKDGDLPNALNPLRMMTVSAMLVVFLLNSRISMIMLFCSGWLVAEFLGILHDYKFGPVWKRLPFPIFDDNHLLFIGSRELVSDRLGGFTFEPGVLGGMVPVFIFLVLMILYVFYVHRAIVLPFYSVVAGAVGVACGFGCLFLAKTKSGIASILIFAVLFALANLFTSAKAKHKLASIGILGIVGLGGGIGYALLKDTDYGTYILKEVNNLYLLFTRGFDTATGEGLGLASRIESMKSAYYGFWNMPTGAGMTRGTIFIMPILDKITPTPEMNMIHNMGGYAFFTGYILEMIFRGGIVGLVIYFLLSARIKASLNSRRIPELGAFAYAFIGLFFVAGMSVTLFPLLDLILLVICCGERLRQEMGEAPPPRNNRLLGV